MPNVRPKKHLGQHFLKDRKIAQNIADQLTGHGGWTKVVEIGPGTGVLTDFLVQKDLPLWLVEIDDESVVYLKEAYPALTPQLLHTDFLTLDLPKQFGDEPLAVIGNFPYNISSQIFFHLLKYRHQVTEIVGMLQREVAQRLAEPPGSRTYGILSVLLQAFYDVEYCFTVSEHVFKPPPKVKSGVIRLRRNERTTLACDEALFFRVVKTAFNQRRKTLRNALKPMLTPESDLPPALLDKRAEQLGVDEFVRLTQGIKNA
ncbi:16S rRNA (adenine1518-N6/adenine1519-N6)-dimethyltransferase [Catalinimonas alkaloidigena]|uniref:Ribosomal RNA small subunit methyltransferase A n=1 Tax=Catalinimonas alkaloidigena TaxID=1075417 RepID=A0A1G8WFG9_9BACT|nr:16S rRNA (adenine(1518)-N(6)/adenine(1519)-N(6))-dimethyltransferase RsmA [Catalinimonas alkaloidigena]SDJ77044.1 16S rRNA (adenine1518-N6/adenine1519-N6)-dimethyltransferase [Catalinimonas alkaloidigena]